MHGTPYVTASILLTIYSNTITSGSADRKQFHSVYQTRKLSASDMNKPPSEIIDTNSVTK